MLTLEENRSCPPHLETVVGSLFRKIKENHKYILHKIII